MTRTVKRGVVALKIEVKPALKVVGDSTEASIRSGIYFGYLGLVDGIISRMKAGIRTEVQVIATGGNAKMIAAGSDYIDFVDSDLIPYGLRSIAAQHSQPSNQG